MAGLVHVVLRWSTRIRRQSPADVVLSCSKVLGSWMTSPKYLGEGFHVSFKQGGRDST